MQNETELGMDMPLVSVIVPVFNVAEYIVPCLDSIVSQSYKNLEILVVDDGSTDESGVICDEYSHEDKRITVFHRVNHGLSATRNFGIAHCSGEWVCFVDSDDFIEEYMIEALVYNAKKTGAAIVMGEDCIVSADNKNDKKAVFHNKSVEEDECIIEDVDLLVQTIVSRKLRKAVWANLYQVDLVKSSLFEEGKLYEDIPYLPLIMRSKPKVARVHRVVYAYRMNPSSITHVALNIHTAERIEMTELLVRRIKEYFPEIETCAVAFLYAECMTWWMKAVETDDAESKEKLQDIIMKSIHEHPLTLRVLGDRRISVQRRISLVLARINFRGTCWMKKKIMDYLNAN